MAEQQDATAAFRDALTSVINETPSKIVLTPETFDGSGKICDWEVSVTTAQKLNKWTDEDLARYIPAFLKGKALNYYQQIDDAVKENPKEVIEILVKRFSPNQRIQFAKYEHATQGNETIEEFGSRVMRLLSDGMPGKTRQELEPFAINKFCGGLSNLYVRQRMFENIPLTMADAVSKAKTFSDALAIATVGCTGEDEVEVSVAEEPNTATATDAASAGPQSERGRGMARGGARGRGRGRGRGGNGSQSQSFPKWTCSCCQVNPGKFQFCKTCGGPRNFCHCKECGAPDNFPGREECFRCGAARGSGPDRSKDVCRQCGETGHWARECPNAAQALNN